MRLRSLCAAIIITMLCAPFMAKAGLRELNAAVDQAEKAKERAIKNARAYFENYQIEYDAALELQKKAVRESSLAINAYMRAWIDALNRDCKRSEDDEAFLEEKERELEEKAREWKATNDWTDDWRDDWDRELPPLEKIT